MNKQQLKKTALHEKIAHHAFLLQSVHTLEDTLNALILMCQMRESMERENVVTSSPSADHNINASQQQNEVTNNNNNIYYDLNEVDEEMTEAAEVKQESPMVDLDEEEEEEEEEFSGSTSTHPSGFITWNGKRYVLKSDIVRMAGESSGFSPQRKIAQFQQEQPNSEACVIVGIEHYDQLKKTYPHIKKIWFQTLGDAIAEPKTRYLRLYSLDFLDYCTANK